MADEIIEELWRIKDDMAREHGYDIKRLAAYFQRREREGGRPVLGLRAKRGSHEESGSVQGESSGRPGA